MKPTGFGNFITFLLTPPTGETFHISSEISHDLLNRLAQHFVDIQAKYPTDFGDPLSFPKFIW